MDSVFEKITLYDILGYIVPGSLIVMSVCGKFLLGSYDDAVSLYENFKGVLTYGFILFSFICGVLVSELSRRWINWKEKKKKEKEKADKFSVPEDVIKRALKNANIIEDDIEDVDQYIEYMYGDIQSDKEYKRVHNYASAEVMYKNLAFSTPISMIIVSSYFCGQICIMVPIIIAGMLCAYIFWMRRERFCEKKRRYAVGWYVKKHVDCTVISK